MATFSLETKFAEAVIDAAELRGALAPERVIVVAGAHLSPMVFFQLRDRSDWLVIDWPSGLDGRLVVTETAPDRALELLAEKGFSNG